MTRQSDSYEDLAQRYANAWNAHDLAAVMALHTDDTRYQLHGRTPPVEGRAEVEALFKADLESMPDIHFELVTLHGSASHAVFQSKITWTVDGRPVGVDGMDLLTIRDGLVHTKDTYFGRRSS